MWHDGRALSGSRVEFVRRFLSASPAVADRLNLVRKQSFARHPRELAPPPGDRRGLGVTVAVFSPMCCVPPFLIRASPSDA